MKFFNRSKHDCTGVCELYKAPKTTTAEGVINQFKCDNCNYYLFPNGIISGRGEKICKCCSKQVVYVKSIKDDPDVIEKKKSIKNSFTRETFGRKTFEQFLEFLEDEIQLQANYQLVVLKFLIGRKMSEKIEIAEELAYQNNKNFNDKNEVKKFLTVPVFDVLENRGFIKKIVHYDEEQYMLNVEMTEFEVTRSIEILEKKLREYNLEHDIPENQFDSLSNNNSSMTIESSNTKNQNDIPDYQEPNEVYEKIKENSPDVEESTSEKTIFLENSSNGIMLKKYVEINSEEIIKGQILSNDDLMDKFGVGNMGGIRHSKKNNILVLCSSFSNDYIDSIDPHSGLINYSGEGRIGDQEISKGNAKILDSKNNMLFFKEKYQETGARKRGALDNLYEFVGKVRCVKHYWKEEQDVEKNQRKVVKFVLEVES